MRKLTDGIVIRSLRPSDLHTQMLVGFQHRQVISDKWVKDGNGYKLIKTGEIREWDNDKRIWIPGYLMRQIDRGGAAAGAFVNGRMIGFASLDGILRIEFIFRRFHPMIRFRFISAWDV